MAYKPLRMDNIKLIIDYHRQGVSKKKMARLLGLSRNTIKKYIRRIDNGGFNDENVSTHSKGIYGQAGTSEILRDEDIQKRLPKIVSELGRVGVTRRLLWQEYQRDYPEGFSYCRFCKKIGQYRARNNVTIRLEHKAAHTLSVDFSGKKVSWIEKKTAEIHLAEVLVCTLPYSGFTFAYALPSQKQEDFIEGINQAFLYLGGLPQVLLGDNLKSFVTKSDRYEPTFNELCVQLSSYYGIELQATRVYKPKDKASVERHVSIVYNKIYAPLRDASFFSLAQINEAFLPQLDHLNKIHLQGKDYSRHDIFTKDEKPYLTPLPNLLFEIRKSTKAKVQRNYHVILGEDWHQYSVPYQYVGKNAEISYNSKEVEVYCGAQRIAIHKRDGRPHGYSTLPIHMPEKHLKYLEQKGWDENYFKKQAEKIGPHTLWAITSILESKALIEQTYNACLGLLRLEKTYSKERLETACRKAHGTHRVNFGIIRNILKKNMDKAPDKKSNDLFNIPNHDNVRGAQNYY